MFTCEQTSWYRKQTDLGAHLFGFCSGVLLGIAAEYLMGKFGRPKAVLNSLLALLSGTLVIAAWWVALESGSGW